ncbi:lipid A oxidase (Involved in formation of 2-aminogluconate) protein [Wenxinia marina]|nr:lipid A oxidase (Involved in formation of 2-aminogluconate) protein [Wenxinia marina]
MRTIALAASFGALPLCASAELSFSLYGGLQSSPHSGLTVEGDRVVPDTDVTAGWEGRSTDTPPYYGLRATWWANDRLGFGLDVNHTKVYADDETLAETGFDRLEFSDGLNIVTANAYYRWPGALGQLTPYVGGGVGVAIPHVELTSNGSETFEYQMTGPAVAAIAGVEYDVSDSVSVFAEYKGTYSMNEAELEDGGTLETDIVTNAVNVGVSFSF